MKQITSVVTKKEVESRDKPRTSAHFRIVGLSEFRNESRVKWFSNCNLPPQVRSIRLTP